MKRHLCAFALVASSTLSLAASAFAGPGVMVMMLHGKMVMVTPLDHDITYANGAKAMKSGEIMIQGKKMRLAEGEAISAEGLLMKPHSTQAHGG